MTQLIRTLFLCFNRSSLVAHMDISDNKGDREDVLAYTDPVVKMTGDNESQTLRMSFGIPTVKATRQQLADQDTRNVIRAALDAQFDALDAEFAERHDRLAGTPSLDNKEKSESIAIGTFAKVGSESIKPNEDELADLLASKAVLDVPATGESNSAEPKRESDVTYGRWRFEEPKTEDAAEAADGEGDEMPPLEDVRKYSEADMRELEAKLSMTDTAAKILNLNTEDWKKRAEEACKERDDDKKIEELVDGKKLVINVSRNVRVCSVNLAHYKESELPALLKQVQLTPGLPAGADFVPFGSAGRLKRAQNDELLLNAVEGFDLEQFFERILDEDVHHLLLEIVPTCEPPVYITMMEEARENIVEQWNKMVKPGKFESMIVTSNENERQALMFPIQWLAGQMRRIHINDLTISSICGQLVFTANSVPLPAYIWFESVKHWNALADTARELWVFRARNGGHAAWKKALDSLHILAQDYEEKAEVEEIMKKHREQNGNVLKPKLVSAPTDKKDDGKYPPSEISQNVSVIKDSNEKEKKVDVNIACQDMLDGFPEGIRVGCKRKLEWLHKIPSGHWLKSRLDDCDVVILGLALVELEATFTITLVYDDSITLKGATSVNYDKFGPTSQKRELEHAKSRAHKIAELISSPLKTISMPIPNKARGVVGFRATWRYDHYDDLMRVVVGFKLKSAAIEDPSMTTVPVSV